MTLGVAVQELRQRKSSMAALAVGMSILSFGMLSILSTLGDGFNDLLDGFPESLLEIMGGDVPGGYIVGELFNLELPFVFVTYAVVTGAASIAGEERAGTMAILMSLPISRSRLLIEKCMAMSISTAVPAAIFAAATVAGAAVFDVPIATQNIVATVIHLLFLTWAFGLLAICAGAATGRTDLAMAIAGLTALLSYLASSMLPITGNADLARFSPWFYYAGNKPLSNGVDYGHLALLTVLSVAILVIGHHLFIRRDLKG